MLPSSRCLRSCRSGARTDNRRDRSDPRGASHRAACGGDLGSAPQPAIAEARGGHCPRAPVRPLARGCGASGSNAQLQFHGGRAALVGTGCGQAPYLEGVVACGGASAHGGREGPGCRHPVVCVVGTTSGACLPRTRLGQLCRGSRTTAVHLSWPDHGVGPMTRSCNCAPTGATCLARLWCQALLLTQRRSCN